MRFRDLWRRFKNIFRSKANKVISNLEEPIEQLDLSIKEKQVLISKTKQDSARLIGSVATKKQDLENLEKTLKKNEEALKLAGSKNDTDNMQRFAIEIKNLREQKQNLLQVIQNLETGAENIKNKIKEAEETVSKMKIKKNELAARISTAKTTAQINESLQELNNLKGMSLGDIEEKVKDAESYAIGLEELGKKDQTTEEYLNEANNDVDDIIKEIMGGKEEH